MELQRPLMAKYVLILAFILGLAYEFTRTPGKGFDYRAAPVAERETYLESQSSLAKKRVGRALGSKYGYFSKISIESSKVISQGVQLNLIYSDENARTNAYRMVGELKETVCPAYLKLPLAENGLKLTLVLIAPKGQRLATVALNSSVCSRFAGS